MLTLGDYENLKSMGVTGFKEFYEPFMKMGDDISINEAKEQDLGISYNENINSYYNEAPEIVVNIPANGNIEFNFESEGLNSEGELTSSIDEDEDTVKSDPFDISPIISPDDPQASLEEDFEEQKSVETEDTTPRFMTLQDLM